MLKKYLSGFGNEFSTEALPGALPIGQNSPQKPRYGLYAEQLTGSSFTAPRHENKRSWLYRIRPSVVHGEYKSISQDLFKTSPLNSRPTPPTQMRWSPIEFPNVPTDFVSGLQTIVANGHASMGVGCAIHLFAINTPMKDRFFSSSDGEFLIIAQEGGLHFRTEMGELTIEPGEIAVIPRGVKFQVDPLDFSQGKPARGYVCENYGPLFRLPGLGPIGANGLANARDFLAPIAAFYDKKGKFELINKFQGGLWSCELEHHPLDVVAWHGNYAPYKYDLRLFNTMNTVSYDHPDPSIFTVLTSPTTEPGVANIDFVIFPERWMVGENTFRPPYFHRNLMSEYMGLIYGSYDAKPSQDFAPGGGSLHNCMSAHGPDAEAFAKATEQELKPERYKDTLAFMLESRFPYRVSELGFDEKLNQKDYPKCWRALKSHFNGA
jgi:homogentisate 1,2-dioxygenase